MEKPLFTKLVITEPSQSQHIAQGMLQHLINHTQQLIRKKQLEGHQTEYLTNHIMKTEIQTLNQAVTRKPMNNFLTEDITVVNRAYEPKRPMSAKINYIPRKETQHPRIMTKNGKKKNCRSTYNSLKSTQTIERSVSHVNRFEKENSHQFIPLARMERQPEEEMICELRLKKVREIETEKSKQQFFNWVAEEEEKNSKQNKRFIQMMGHKTYYYNGKGEAIEVQKTQSNLKKTGKIGSFATINTLGGSRAVLSQQVSKKQFSGHSKGESIFVQYKGKNINFRSSLQSQVLDEKAQALFFKSDQCKYKIIE